MPCATSVPTAQTVSINVLFYLSYLHQLTLLTACHICGKANKAKSAVPTVDGQKRTFK